MIDFKQDVIKLASMKIALNAQKARELAKSVGLIPHPQSEWKWALRQLRKTNPQAIKNAPLMLEGKELAKAKEKMGVLPNNILQKVRSITRRSGKPIEVGVSTDKDYFLGNNNEVTVLGNILAHTHPDSNRILNAEEVKNLLKEIKFDKGIGTKEGIIRTIIPTAYANNTASFLDNTLAARPSGQGSFDNYTRTFIDAAESYDSAKNKAFGAFATRHNISVDDLLKHVIERRRTLKRMRALDKEIDFVRGLYEDLPASGLKRASEKYELDRRIKRHTREYSNHKRKLNNFRKKHKISRSNLNKIYNHPITQMVRNGIHENSPIDYGDMVGLFKRTYPQAILGRNVQGVHKYRSALPNNVRSVYFNGGWGS